MDTLFYITLHTTTLPTLDTLLGTYPEGDIIGIKQSIPLLDAQPKTGYRKLVFQDSGHRYTLLNRGKDKRTGLYCIEISLSPSRHNQTVHPEKLVADFAAQLAP